MHRPDGHGLRLRPAIHRAGFGAGSSRLPVWRGPSRTRSAPRMYGAASEPQALSASSGPFPVAIDDGDQAWTIRCSPFPALDFLRHLSRTAHAVEPDRISRSAPKSVQGLVELGHYAFHESAITVPILDEDPEGFLGKAGGVLGCELIRRTRKHRDSHASSVWRQSPGTAPNRRNEHLAYPVTLGSAITNPGRGLDCIGIRPSARVPHVPAIVDLVQNAVQPPVGLRVVRCAEVDLYPHHPYSFGRAARRMARISS